MTVKELIIKLLEEPMGTEVQLSIDAPHQDEHGDCSGYVFDIDSVSHEFGECMIKFIDWREKKMSNAVWVHKGMYGNGTAFAPFMDLYECSNCKALSVEPFDVCPECNLNMTREGDSNDTNG